ncbi:2-hydroxychromene-2-carboxylate isomerase [Ferribacterium limneticum]|uniref:2-hydroxychromene-2-carboxylate isomerase n=1 Tax=Ferribacterium limneticum TaxID=76259 RepID=UPI001CF94011|nr:2-hydroxychromene-2-carboxylate isomerase [Ferribacterium limneticum]UCV28636.1 2-hydroxychromene-2-carboxylate isomerase [Ferribacterium limneticum]UCV32553.1 2-hydroxychromene-2-carboxylate isomerase [Ferribacterium limneticum]
MTDNDKAPIDFWFDFSSPYGYLMSEKIDALAAQYGRKVRWHPILLGIIFQATGSRPPADGVTSKGKYMFHDFYRSARYMGIPYTPPSRFPLPTQNAARAYYWLHGQDCALARAFAHAVYRGFFVDDRDISSPDTVLDIAEKLGVDRTTLAAALQSPEIKARLNDECEQALAAGVFGSPHVVIDGEAFFGADRLPQIEHWLEIGGF